MEILTLANTLTNASYLWTNIVNFLVSTNTLGATEYRLLRGSTVLWQGTLRPCSADLSSTAGNQTYQLQVRNSRWLCPDRVRVQLQQASQVIDDGLLVVRQALR